MIRVESPPDQVNVAKVYEAGQDQIFEYWDDLGAPQRKELLSQIDLIDFQELARLTRTLILEDGGHDQGRVGQLEPAQLIPLTEAGNGHRVELNAAIAAGNEALRQGQVAVFLVAGGQGTRLRFEGPKGIYPIAPITGKSLFQLHAEKLVAVQRRYRCSIPLIIMTSDSNHEATEQFFKEHSYFGLNAADVMFERQGMLPVVDGRRGKILLRSRHEIVISPNGHGGSVAVVQSLRDTLHPRGIRYLFYQQVDNPMIILCDPAFIGYHIVRDSDFSSKAVPKTHPDEKVGVFCRTGNQLAVVEYTELDDEARHATDADGRLAFRGGNLACHVISLGFLAPAEGEASFEMPYHVAHKATPYLRSGEQVEADAPNSIKFESFLFDVLPYASNPIVLETSRREYAPVKNFSGECSPDATRRALIEQWSSWLQEAGYEVPRAADGEVCHPVEISALLADNAETLRERLDGRELDLSRELLLE